MKLLIIDEEFPYPLNTGKRLRTYNLTRELAKENEVHYLAFGTESSDSFKHFQNTHLNPHAVAPLQREQSGSRFYAKLFMNLFSPLPYIVTSHYSRSFEQVLIDLQKKHRFDIMICEWSPYARYLENLSDCRKIIVAHNIEATIWKRYAENESNPVKRWYIQKQYEKVAAFEKSCFHLSDGATAVTKQEADTINSYGVPYATEVIDNGVDTEYFHPIETPVKQNRLVFTGSMDWRPNQDAAIFFAEEILPLLKKMKPDIEAVFVGRNPPEHIKALEKFNGFELTGTVDDVRPYIADAALYIVPLRIGGGSRLKILEAMAMKKTVISTSVGAEGLNVKNKDTILLADSAETFAKLILEHLPPHEQSIRVAENGYHLVHREYRWEQLGKKLNAYLTKIAGNR